MAVIVETDVGGPDDVISMFPSLSILIPGHVNSPCPIPSRKPEDAVNKQQDLQLKEHHSTEGARRICQQDTVTEHPCPRKPATWLSVISSFCLASSTNLATEGNTDSTLIHVQPASGNQDMQQQATARPRQKAGAESCTFPLPLTNSPCADWLDPIISLHP
jgi:hypothetical protein